MNRYLLCLPLLLGIGCLAPGLFAQSYQSFINPIQINIPDIGPADVYPSLITVSGQPNFLHDVRVHFELAQHENGFSDMDILLEAPNGQKVLLCSDAADGILFMNNWWFGNSNLPLFTFDAVVNDDQNEFRPSNFEAFDDFFPAPGPGTITQPQPSLHTLDGINPNGVWKLWVLSDDQNDSDGSIGYNNVLGDFGWELSIKADATPPCARPEKPEILMLEDTFAMLRWPVNGTENQWDMYHTTDPLALPDANTPPTLAGVGQSDNVLLPGLTPDREYFVWVRSNCGSNRSDWIGPLRFQTGIYPCRNPLVATMCEPFSLQALPPFYNWRPDACTGLSQTAPKRMVQFTAPITGLFNLTGLQGLGNGHAAYKALGSCDTIGWTCWDGNAVPNYEFAVNLTEGVSYWFYFEGISGNNVRFDACPMALDPNWGAVLKPIAVSHERGQFRWYQSDNGNQAIPGDWDILYQSASQGAPGFDVPASETNLQTDAAGFFTLDQTLQPASDYALFIRRNCGDTWTCWSNPVAFSTPTLLSTAADVRLDSSLASGSLSAFLSWENTPASASDVKWEVSWGYVPFDDPQLTPVNLFVESRVWTKLNDLSPSRDYNLWLRPRFTANNQTHPYWVQEWQGPFLFTTPDQCNLPWNEIYCMENVRAGFLSGTHTLYEHLDLPPAVCAADTSKSGWEVVFKFRSPVNGPVNIVPTDARGKPGRQSLVYYKKASQGCWAADSWENIGCWEMGATPPTLSFDAEKDTLYYLAFDTRRLGNSFTVDDFGFRLEACPAACPLIEGLTCVYTDDTSAIIQWNSLGPGKTYTLEYFGLDTAQWASFNGLTDTTFTFVDLSPTQEYVVQIFHQCNGQSVLSEAIRLRIGANHPHLGRSFFSGCNPQYQRPGAPADRVYFYDHFQIEVPVAGQYTLEVKKSECLTQSLNNAPFFISVYENAFDPANPTANLLGFTDSLAMTATPTQFSVSLEAGKEYFCVISPVDALYSPLFTPIEEFCVRYEVKGAGYATLSRPVFQGRLAGLHGQLEATALFDPFPDYSCADTSGWLHYFRRGSDENRYDDDFILLSRENYGGGGATYVANGGGALQLQSPPATYATNSAGWFVLDRYWDVQTSLYEQPVRPVLVRFYFTEADFQALRDSVVAAGGTPPDQVEQLYFYKINDYFDRYNPDPKAGHVGIPAASSNRTDGYWEYKNGPEATDSTWRYEPFLNGHLAETLVHRFSGGGGGVGGNLKGAVSSVWVRPSASRPDVRVFPNPTSGWLMLEGIGEYPDARLFLRDMMGNLRLQQTANQSEPLDISTLAPGVYFLTIETPSGRGTWQVVKTD